MHYDSMFRIYKDGKEDSGGFWLEKGTEILVLAIEYPETWSSWADTVLTTCVLKDGKVVQMRWFAERDSGALQGFTVLSHGNAVSSSF